MSRRLDPERARSHALGDLCVRYGVSLDRPHDALHDAQVFERGVALIPVFVAWQAIDILETSQGESDVLVFVTRLVLATAIVLVVRGLMALLSAANSIYEKDPKNRNRMVQELRKQYQSR